MSEVRVSLPSVSSSVRSAVAYSGSLTARACSTWTRKAGDLTGGLAIRLELLDQIFPDLFILMRDFVNLIDADINHAFRGEPCYASIDR